MEVILETAWFTTFAESLSCGTQVAPSRGTLANNLNTQLTQEDLWIANQHVTRFSTLAINMQIKAITQLFEWESKPVNCWGRLQSNWNSHHCCWDFYIDQREEEKLNYQRMETFLSQESRRNNNICPQEVLYTNVCTNFICNSSKLETIQSLSTGE